ncbi:hypothetical protein [Halomonas koreensis]|uniref:Uncharacterized protein n=1 Tax=Halomonas koreensis TaxID=245385 RepID=A0ABU1G1D0_9GAMM|nr:hypothetical protein [Halomonas koreensis]MDR5866737.1 hypothetical protein [Halomonas koreensis]
MSKLHFYRNIGGHVTKFADGEGDLSHNGEFTAYITHGYVDKGKDYEIRQGKSPCGNSYRCLAGASKSETARFESTPDSSLEQADEEYLGAALALRAAMLASQKSVSIQIDPDELKILKANDYKLCFAKKVAGGDYNVVWQSYDKYLASNSFSWTPQYQLFGSNKFEDRVKVEVSTQRVTIGLGEESILDTSGVLGQPKSGGSETAITMVNQYGPIHPGLSQLSTGIDGQQISTPFYVAPHQAVKGETSLTPVEKVLVWFEQDIQTSSMFSTSRANSIEIDLTNSNSETRLYKDGKWTTP